MEDQEDVISRLLDLRGDLNRIWQGAQRKLERTSWLGNNNYDVFEERIRLDSLKDEISHMREKISDAAQQIKKCHMTSGQAMQFLQDISREVASAKATLDDIQVPKLSQVMAA